MKRVKNYKQFAVIVLIVSTAAYLAGARPLQVQGIIIYAAAIYIIKTLEERLD